MKLQRINRTPVRIVILNLMPNKEVTERQLKNRLEAATVPTEITLLTTESYISKNVSREYLETYYKTFSQIKEQYFDGMIITGAPVECMEYQDVLYWDELEEIMDWAQEHTKSVLHICWGAQAGIYHHYGIQKHKLDEKLSGVYEHHIFQKQHPLMNGIKEGFVAPHSRYTTVLQEDVLKIKELDLIAGSDATQCYVVADRDCKNIFVMGHMEYDLMTLDCEYHRDLKKEGVNPHIPYNYYPENDVTKVPEFKWLKDSNIFFHNWVHAYLCQNDVKKRREKVCVNE